MDNEHEWFFMHWTIPGILLFLFQELSAGAFIMSCESCSISEGKVGLGSWKLSWKVVSSTKLEVKLENDERLTLKKIWLMQDLGQASIDWV